MKRTLRKYKTIIKYKLSNNKTKPIHLVILSCVIILFSFGFAFLATGVGINGVTIYTPPNNVLDVAENLEFRGSSYLTNIKTITLNTNINVPTTTVATWDVSENSDGKVMAYIIENSTDNTKYDLYIQANGYINANSNSSSLFGGMTNLTTINNLEYLDTSDVTNMADMFLNCTLLSTINLSNFDTNNVTNMAGMFAYCNSLTSLNLSSFDTSNVTNMANMFLSCTLLSTINLSSFDTENVTIIEGMFSNCSSLTSLDLSSFNTSNVTNMKLFLMGCSGLNTIDLSGFNTENVTTMVAMFSNCTSLTSLDLSNFNTSNVTTMLNIFLNCTSLSTIDLSSFDTSNVTNMQGMFYNCSSLSSLNISNFDASKVEYMSSMFDNVPVTISIPKTTGSLANTSTTYYGSSSSVYATGTFNLIDPLDAFITKVKAGNATSADVGTTFTVNLGSTYGDHTLRVANVSTPTECSGEDFSGTACGVVFEFTDIITKYNMNPSGTYKGTTYNYGWNVDGWPASEMRTFVNDDIYNSLPTSLKSAIIDTTVISSHGSLSGETNFTSTDKLYLLSTHEVWTDSDGSTMGIDYYDSSYSYTRQLDYYANNNVKSTSSYSSAIKYYSGSASKWWLRSAISLNKFYFYFVYTDGSYDNDTADTNLGVSPAFRIA